MAAVLLELCNGERPVVFLFVSRVLLSIPQPLLYEAAAFCLLAIAGLAVEISAENSPATLNRFKTRPGALSGILLGSVTLPTVMLSRLIQMSRALSANDLELKGNAYLNVQYWAVSASCFAVLIFMYQILHQSSKNNCSLHLWNSKASKCCTLYIASYTVTCYLSFARKSYSGCNVTFNMSWLLIHGLATVILIQHILQTFPSCASIGEALLVSSGLVLYFGLVVRPSPFAKNIQNFSSSLVVLYIFQQARGAICEQRNMQKDWKFHSVLCSSLRHVSHDSSFMDVLCPGFSCVSCAMFYNISKHSKIERILLRKYYHLVAVLMFLPALLYQPIFLDLAFGAALAIFLGLEMIQVWKIWPLGNIVHQFMNAFTDHRDSKILIVRHQWWATSMAFFVGAKLASPLLSSTILGQEKTIEGTASGITSVLATCAVLLPLLASTGYTLSQHWFSLVVAVYVSGFLEACTAQLDNAFIPLVFYSLLCL